MRVTLRQRQQLAGNVQNSLTPCQRVPRGVYSPSSARGAFTSRLAWSFCCRETKQVYDTHPLRPNGVVYAPQRPQNDEAALQLKTKVFLVPVTFVVNFMFRACRQSVGFVRSLYGLSSNRTYRENDANLLCSLSQTEHFCVACSVLSSREIRYSSAVLRMFRTASAYNSAI